jgi:NitT/TauT family transport system substrate-binding protein
MLCRFIVVLTLSICSLPAIAQQKTDIRFVNDWKWEGQSAPLLLAKDNGFFDKELLNVTLEPGTGSVNALPLVASGEYQMGSADINSLITWRDKNPDVDMKAVYLIYSAPPYAVLSRPSLGVVGPQDLEDHILGAPKFDGAFAQWPAFVVANGIIEERVTIKDVGFPEREALLAAGEVDAITGFSFTSYISLQTKGVPAKDISLMLMSDFGLDLYGNAIIVNPEFAAANPKAVSGFIRAAVKGYQQTISNPTAAVQHVLSRNEKPNEEVELRRLIMAIGHHIVTDESRAIGLGDIVDVRLEKSIKQLKTIHNFTSTPRAKDIFDRGYLPEIGLRLVPDTSQKITVVEGDEG